MVIGVFNATTQSISVVFEVTFHHSNIDADIGFEGTSETYKELPVNIYKINNRNVNNFFIQTNKNCYGTLTHQKKAI